MNRLSALYMPLACLALPAVAGEFAAGKFTIDFDTRVSRECSFPASPIDYCDPLFVDAYERAMVNKKINFNQSMIVITINSRPRYKQQTVVAINPETRKVYPLPFDFFSYSFSDSIKDQYGRLIYSIESNQICIEGEIMAYRSTQSGDLCWRFIGNKFVGEVTPYTYPDK